MKSREERLLPGVKPRYVWLYEGGGGSGAKYRAVFTGLFDLKKPGEYPYLVVNESGKGEALRGRPPAERIRYEVGYEDLPEDVRRTVLEAYREVWNLDGWSRSESPLNNFERVVSDVGLDDEVHYLFHG